MNKRYRYICIHRIQEPCSCFFLNQGAYAKAALCNREKMAHRNPNVMTVWTACHGVGCEDRPTDGAEVEVWMDHPSFFCQKNTKQWRKNGEHLLELSNCSLPCHQLCHRRISADLGVVVMYYVWYALICFWFHTASKQSCPSPLHQFIIGHNKELIWINRIKSLFQAFRLAKSGIWRYRKGHPKNNPIQHTSTAPSFSIPCQQAAAIQRPCTRRSNRDTWAKYQRSRLSRPFRKALPLEPWNFRWFEVAWKAKPNQKTDPVHVPSRHVQALNPGPSTRPWSSRIDAIPLVGGDGRDFLPKISDPWFQNVSNPKPLNPRYPIIL